MVRLWAEKEMRNLKRLAAAGIKCPDPLEVRENVLVMTFVGSKEGWWVFHDLFNVPCKQHLFHCNRASPRLKDAELPPASCAALYRQLVLIVRRMFHECKLVHADLSEYNILLHEENLWIIDVSQSVEHDHPSAFDFLKSDIKNVEDFFGRLGVRCLGLRRCFEFVTRDKHSEDAGQEEAVLETWLGEEGLGEIDEEEGNLAIPTSERAEDAAHEDSVFLRSFIPRTLNDVYDPERDVAKLSRGEGSGLIYADTIGVVGPEGDDSRQGLVQKRRPRVKFQDQAVELSGSNTMANSKDIDVELGEGSGQESVDDSDSDDEVEEAKKEGFVDRTPRGHRHEDRDAKKVSLTTSRS
jgi:RIO kinase 1